MRQLYLAVLAALLFCSAWHSAEGHVRSLRFLSPLKKVHKWAELGKNVGEAVVPENRRQPAPGKLDDSMLNTDSPDASLKNLLGGIANAAGRVAGALQVEVKVPHAAAEGGPQQAKKRAPGNILGEIIFLVNELSEEVAVMDQMADEVPDPMELRVGVPPREPGAYPQEVVFNAFTLMSRFLDVSNYLTQTVRPALAEVDLADSNVKGVLDDTVDWIVRHFQLLWDGFDADEGLPKGFQPPRRLPIDLPAEMNLDKLGQFLDVMLEEVRDYSQETEDIIHEVASFPVGPTVKAIVDVISEQVIPKVEDLIPNGRG